MASSLDRIFNKKFATSPKYYDEEETASGSETESVPESFAHLEDDGSDYEPSGKQPRRGPRGVTPAEEDEQKIQRKPTRRPNPKIFNRNALLARENRRRKKEHVDNLEREISELKQRQDQMSKQLNKKSRQVKKLTTERDYLKAVIANRTGIMSVLRAVQGTPGLSMGSAAARTPAAASSYDEGFGSSPRSTLTASDDDLYDRGQFNDLGFSPLEEQVLDTIPLNMGDLLAPAAQQQVITTEHNYSEHSNHTSLDSGSAAAAGVCVHIVPGGRVSVEFCASCALSSSQGLLQDILER